MSAESLVEVARLFLFDRLHFVREVDAAGFVSEGRALSHGKFLPLKQLKPLGLFSKLLL